MPKNTNRCIAPFTQLTIDPVGNTSPCPYLGGMTWQFDKDSTVQERWTGAEFEDLRKSHINNERDERCQRCWNEEDAGKQSLRKRLYTDFALDIGQIDQSIEDKTYLKGPITLTMKNGNVCNLQCRSCGPKDSMAWLPEAKHYIEKYPNDLGGTWFEKERFKKNWNQTQLEDMSTWNHNLQRLELYGGEPLYNKKVLEHLQSMDPDTAKNITLYFNTNANHIPSQEWKDAMSKFKKVEFMLSLDGVEDQFEYIRHPGKWRNVLMMRAWLKLNSKWLNISHGIITTVSIMNVYYLPEILDLFEDSWAEYVFLNIVELPTHFCIKNLPDPVKIKVANKLLNSKHKHKLIEIVNFMNAEPCNEIIWTRYLNWTQRIDDYRQQSFQTTFPEFYSCIPTSYLNIKQSS